MPEIFPIFMKRSEEPRHKWEKKKLRKIEKKEYFHFWKFLGMSTSKCCWEVSFGYFWAWFSEIDREIFQEVHRATKWKYLFRLMPGFRRSPHICLKFFPNYFFSIFQKRFQTFLKIFPNVLEVSLMFTFFENVSKTILKFFHPLVFH